MRSSARSSLKFESLWVGKVGLPPLLLRSESSANSEGQPNNAWAIFMEWVRFRCVPALTNVTVNSDRALGKSGEIPGLNNLSQKLPNDLRAQSRIK
jgi:hypothetical protein